MYFKGNLNNPFVTLSENSVLHVNYFLIEYVSKKIDNFFQADVFRERCNFTLPLLGVDIDTFGKARTERAARGKELRSRVMMSTRDLVYVDLLQVDLS